MSATTTSTSRQDYRLHWAAAFAQQGGLDLPRHARLFCLAVARKSDRTGRTGVLATYRMQLPKGSTYGTTKRGMRRALQSGWLEQVTWIDASTRVYQLAIPSEGHDESTHLLRASTDVSKGGRPREMGHEVACLAELGVELVETERLRSCNLVRQMPDTKKARGPWAIAVIEELVQQGILDLPEQGSRWTVKPAHAVNTGGGRLLPLQEVIEAVLEDVQGLVVDPNAVQERMAARSGTEQASGDVVDAASILMRSLTRPVRTWSLAT